jgi:uncharacterized protein YuzE
MRGVKNPDVSRGGESAEFPEGVAGGIDGGSVMVTLETIEGRVNGKVPWHYDVGADVLYLRRVGTLDVPTLGEATDDGLIELRNESSGDLIGITIVSWWKRFGSGAFPDSLKEVERSIEPWAQRAA